MPVLDIVASALPFSGADMRSLAIGAIVAGLVALPVTARDFAPAWRVPRLPRPSFPIFGHDDRLAQWVA